MFFTSAKDDLFTDLLAEEKFTIQFTTAIAITEKRSNNLISFFTLLIFKILLILSQKTEKKRYYAIY